MKATVAEGHAIFRTAWRPGRPVTAAVAVSAEADIPALAALCTVLLDISGTVLQRWLWDVRMFDARLGKSWLTSKREFLIGDFCVHIKWQFQPGGLWRAFKRPFSWTKRSRSSSCGICQNVTGRGVFIDWALVPSRMWSSRRERLLFRAGLARFM